LTHASVLQIRTAIYDNDVERIAKSLADDPRLANSAFVTDRGVSRPLHIAAHCPAIEILLSAGAAQNDLTSRGDTPLTLRLRYGDVEPVKLLLERGCDPNLGFGYHMPSSVMRELIPVLIEHGWNLQNAPFLHDANHGHGNRIVTWLEFGVDPNTTDSDGKTALHFFAARGTGESAIRALVEAGANLNAADNQGLTPIMLARQASKRVAESTLESLGEGWAKVERSEMQRNAVVDSD
ncbi:MAG: ankyrin repeat domain-containing protein, partial [Planctomycetota bacterium]